MNNIRALIIDDEEDFCNFTKIHLESKGTFEVETLTDSRETIRVCATSASSGHNRLFLGL